MKINKTLNNNQNNQCKDKKKVKTMKI